VNDKFTLEQCYAYWRDPGNKHHHPRSLTTGLDKSVMVSFWIRLLVDKNARVLELGCNTGRNLAELHRSGCRNLCGIEINPHAVKLLKEELPHIYDLFQATAIVNEPMEDVLTKLRDKSFDVVFSVASLMFVHPSKQPLVFQQIARIASKYIITIENDTDTKALPGAWAYDYRTGFEKLGWDQLSMLNVGFIQGFDKNVNCRVFRRVA